MAVNDWNMQQKYHHKLNGFNDNLSLSGIHQKYKMTVINTVSEVYVYIHYCYAL
jgi:hypothetical protein